MGDQEVKQAPQDVMVMKFSLHRYCHGQGCSGCDPYGRKVELISLSSLPKSSQYEYGKAQKDFIEAQKNGKSAVEILKSSSWGKYAQLEVR